MFCFMLLLLFLLIYFCIYLLDGLFFLVLVNHNNLVELPN